MYTIKYIKAILVIVVLSMVLLSTATRACICEGVISVADAVKHADIVLKGVVLSKSISYDYANSGILVKGDTSEFKHSGRNIPFAVYRIKVKTVYKGISTLDTMTVLTAYNGAACGVQFAIGIEYIVFGTIKDEMSFSSTTYRSSIKFDTFWTNLCTRTGTFYQDEEKAIKKCLD